MLSWRGDQPPSTLRHKRRRTRRFGTIDTLLQDLRYGLRTLRRSPAFTVAATLILALGIGLSTAVFTVAHSVLLRRLPVGEQDRLVELWGTLPTAASIPIGVSDVRDVERQSRALAHAAFVNFHGGIATPIRDADRVYRVRRTLVSGNFFDVLRVTPALGRTLRASDDVAGAPAVVVLSHRAWQERFNGDSAVVGRTLDLHQTGRSLTVVGVMPRGLDYPRGTEVWAPLIATSAGTADSVMLGSVHLVGRLRSGGSLADAIGELTAHFARPDAPLQYRDFRADGRTLPAILIGDTKSALLIFTAAAALLLVITCINVGNLLLVRGFGRAHEVAVRSALGAGRPRIVGQLLVESVLLAIAGGVLGVGLAWLCVQGFVAIAPAGFPRIDEIALSRWAIAGAVVITGIATLLFAVVPAFATSRIGFESALRAGAPNIAGGRRLRRTTESLVAGQIALAVIVLFAAGLISKSLLRLQQVDLTFQPNDVVIAELALRTASADDEPRGSALLDAVLARVAAVPGVQSVTPVLSVPFVGTSGGIFGYVLKPGQPVEDVAENPLLNMEIVAPNYFATLGIPVLRGRAFTDADRTGGTLTMIISTSAARALWPDADAIGQVVHFGRTRREYTIVGVVPETRYTELRAPRPTVYFPIRQSTFGGMLPLTLVIRTTASTAALAPALRHAVAEDPRVALVSAAPLDVHLAGPRATPRMNAVLLTVFAAAALLLAAVGLFGAVAAMVRQRTRELGIRLALGATRAGVQRMIWRRGLTIAVVGIAIGLTLGAVVSRLLADLLFEVSPFDIGTAAVVSALVVAVAALATAIPARASSQIDPAQALRGDS